MVGPLFWSYSWCTRLQSEREQWEGKRNFLFDTNRLFGLDEFVCRIEWECNDTEDGEGGVEVKGEYRWERGGERKKEREREREEAGLHDTYSHLASGFPNIKVWRVYWPSRFTTRFTLGTTGTFSYHTTTGNMPRSLFSCQLIHLHGVLCLQRL